MPQKTRNSTDNFLKQRHSITEDFDFPFQMALLFILP